jgi:uncharacterized protein with NRDE domain
MCLALVALDAHPRFALVVAANRDEYHARPAAPAAWWDQGWLAGRDLEAGGTWFGVTRGARWAFVTNVRDPSRFDPHAPSRGTLVPAVLSDAAAPSDSIGRIVAGALACNGFNVVAGAGHDACWGSNRADASRALPPGIYGISNAALDTPWPKVERTKSTLAAWCARGDTEVDPLFVMLGDTSGAPDDALPRTGIPLDRERLLAPPFIVSETYGTRCSTILTVDRDGNARFRERSFDVRGVATFDVDQRFAVAPAR